MNEIETTLLNGIQGRYQKVVRHMFKKITKNPINLDKAIYMDGGTAAEIGFANQVDDLEKTFQSRCGVDADQYAGSAIERFFARDQAQTNMTFQAPAICIINTSPEAMLLAEMFG